MIRLLVSLGPAVTEAQLRGRENQVSEVGGIFRAGASRLAALLVALTAVGPRPVALRRFVGAVPRVRNPQDFRSYLMSRSNRSGLATLACVGVIGVIASLSACNRNDATSPISPSPTVFSISGKVFGNGMPLAGASVTIKDGAYAGRVRDTTNDGFYDFRDLAASTMTLEATYPGYVPQSKTVTVSNANQSVDFAISDH